MGMKLIIEQDGIEAAIEAHVRELIPGLAEGTVVDIDLAATRGPAGFTAEIKLQSAEEAEQPALDAPKQAPAPTEQEELATEAEPAPAPVRRQRQVRVSGTKSLGLGKTNDTNELPAETVTETPVADVTAEEPIETAATEETEAETVADNAPVEEAAPNEPAETPVDEPAEAPVEAEPAPARKSLFSNLKKA